MTKQDDYPANAADLDTARRGAWCASDPGAAYDDDGSAEEMRTLRWMLVAAVVGGIGGWLLRGWLS
jgi:hypothetical protein